MYSKLGNELVSVNGFIINLV